MGGSVGRRLISSFLKGFVEALKFINSNIGCRLFAMETKSLLGVLTGRPCEGQKNLVSPISIPDLAVKGHMIRTRNGMGKNLMSMRIRGFRCLPRAAVLPLNLPIS